MNRLVHHEFLLRANAFKILLLALTALLAGPGNALSHPSTCQRFADPLRVNVGDAEMHIPGYYLPYFSGPASIQQQSDPTRNFPLGYCQDAKDPLFNAERLHLSMNQDVRINAFSRESAQYRFLPHLEFEMIAGSAEYCTQSMRKSNGWHVYAANKSFMEITEDPDRSIYRSVKPLVTGLPVYFACHRTLQGNNPSRLCRTWNHPVSQRSHLYFQFSDDEIPPRYWQAMLKELQQFLQSHAAMPLSTPQTPCSSKE